MKTPDRERRETRIFASGNSLAVRLPKGWGRRGESVVLTREGARIVILPSATTLAEAMGEFEPLPPSFKRPKLGPFIPRTFVD